METVSSEFRFFCSLANGIHARPASMLADAARPFSSEVLISKVDGASVNIASVLSVIGLDVKRGDACIILARGADAPEAIAALREFISNKLSEGDELPAGGTAAGGVSEAITTLPIALRRMNVAHATGCSVCGGIGSGLAVVVGGIGISDAARSARAGSPEAERSSARSAIGFVRDDLSRRSQSASGMEKELLNAHLAIARDCELWGEVERAVRGGATAAQGVAAASECFSKRLAGATSAYIRDRAIDVQDVCGQVIERLGGGVEGAAASLKEDSILFAEVLTPNQLLRMERGKVKGLVLGSVGATSHTIILARSMRIPTLIDVRNVALIARRGEPAIVDGDGGYVITEVSGPVARHFAREQATHERWLARVGPIARRDAVTTDGVRLEVGTNASTADEVAAAIEHGADGVGLLRTELLFLDRESAPSEEEQFESYAAVVRACSGKPTIIRTFDIGGDKPAAYLSMPREENPFLGVRGLRLHERYPEMLRTQLRAVVRASAVGPVKVMAPMVSGPREAAWFRDRVREVQNELAASGTAFDARMPVGVMIEIPAAAYTMPELCDEVDFFSIGTNDLCQYFMAVDRGNAGVASLYNPRTPAFLRLLQAIVHGATARGKWVGVCGEMAGERVNLPLMIGLGVDEISVAPGSVMGLKAAVQTLSAAVCKQLFEKAAACRSASEVEGLLAGAAGPAAALPALDAAMIETNCDASSKEEAIKSAVDLLFVAGRTERPREVEEAVWAREETYSTGLGFGFAVPHCKTAAVSAPALAVVKLREAVGWGSMDGLPVSVVMLLAVPAADTSGAHMKVFAKLARKLMHEEFRERLMGTGDANAIAALLARELA